MAKFLELAGAAIRIGRQSPAHGGSGPARSSKPLEANLLSETISASRHSIRTTRRIIIIVVSILIVAMWARVGVALVTFRQHAIEDASSQGRNLMIAFREEIASFCAGSTPK